MGSMEDLTRISGDTPVDPQMPAEQVAELSAELRQEVGDYLEKKAAERQERYAMGFIQSPTRAELLAGMLLTLHSMTANNPSTERAQSVLREGYLKNLERLDMVDVPSSRSLADIRRIAHREIDSMTASSQPELRRMNLEHEMRAWIIGLENTMLGESPSTDRRLSAQWITALLNNEDQPLTFATAVELAEADNHKPTLEALAAVYCPEILSRPESPKS